MKIDKVLNIVLVFILFFNISIAKEFDAQLKRGTYDYAKENLEQNDYIKVSLVDVVLETVSQSNNVKAAREKVLQAKIKLDDAYAGYLPSVDGRYKTARTKTKPGADEMTEKFYGDESYKLTITQNIYEGGATSTTIKNLDKKYEVAKNAYRLVIAKEVENAIKAYFDVLFNFNSMVVNQESMMRLQEVLEIVNIKYESGATSIGDLSNIKASVSNAESKLIKIQSKFNEALEYYKYIVGDNFVKTFPFEERFDTSIDDFDKIVEKAVENNINVKSYKLNIEAQKYKLLNAKSGFKPKIDLELSSEKITDQEDFEEIIRNNKAQIILSYNFYNKGLDKNEVLTMNSMIRELNYKLKEEIRKLKWTLSKLHRSIVSATKASVSTKAEVLASKEMVKAYWDGFKLGEQDLQELLQGQRQLNSAQLDLIANKKSAITDYFNLLSNTGTILNYFKLDIEEDNFINFAKSDYTNLLKTELEEKQKELIVENNSTKNEQIIEDIEENNTTNTVDENLTQVVENNISVVPDSLNDLLNFETLFLETDENKWTIRMYYFDKVYQAFDFAKEQNISKNIFVFDTLNKNKVKTNIAYNIFDTKQLAQESLDELNITAINNKVFQIKDIKNLHNNFKNKKLQTERKVKKEKPFETNKKFKKQFLEAEEDLYTINITSFASIAQAKELVEKEKIYDKSFVYSYGDEKEWIKVVYGVFTSYEDAVVALDSLENIKIKYEPVIEKISSKQNLYKKYNDISKNETSKVVLEVRDTNSSSEVKSEQNDEINSSEAIDVPVAVTSLDSVSFKEQFLNASKEYYTLNLATLYSKESGEKFKKNNDKAVDVFVFKFGKDGTMYKAMGGKYATYAEAQEALEQLPKSLQRNKPRIEKIEIKQKLYFKYNSVKEN